jgi:hypothetical protein
MADSAITVAGQLERQRPPPPVHDHAARRERTRLPALAAGAPPPSHGELEQEQLLEGEPPARLLLVILALREVDRVDHRGALRQALLDPEPGRQRLDRGARQRARLAHERAQPVRGDALRGRMHRHAPERVHRRVPVAEQLVVLHPELVPLAELAVEQDVRALSELARDPGLVEPHGDQWARLVEDPGLDALLAPVSHGLHGNGANGHGDRSLLADGELRGRDQFAVRVRVREVLEQVGLGLDA